MHYHWNWGVFFTEAAQNQTYFDWLLVGLRTTLLLGLFSWIIALVIGSVLGVLRTVPNKWLSDSLLLFRMRSPSTTFIVIAR